MIRNYLTIAWRNLLRNKLFSSLNIFGLAIGMAACFLIMQYVRFELSYDKFHKNGESIYRLIIDGDRDPVATNHPGAGPALKSDFPEVEAYARVVHQGIFSNGVTAWSHTNENGQVKVFNEERVYNVDPSFLTMFNFPFVYGDAASAFPNTSSVVISESVAKKFFGSENPLGKTLTRDGYRSFTVTGVFKDIPENSHIKFDILVSYFMTEGWGDGWNHSWDWKWAEYFTYIQLKSHSQKENIEARLPGFTRKYLGDFMEQTGRTVSLQLQPLTDIHLKSPKLSKEQEVHGNERTVYFLATISVLILVIAWINFVNLSTSKSTERSREEGSERSLGQHGNSSSYSFCWIRQSST